MRRTKVIESKRWVNVNGEISSGEAYETIRLKNGELEYHYSSWRGINFRENPPQWETVDKEFYDQSLAERIELQRTKTQLGKEGW